MKYDIYKLWKKIKSILVKSIGNDTLLEKVHNHNEFRYGFLIIIILVCSISSIAIRVNAEHNKAIQTNISHDIIRFHVIANSDSNEDQELKIKVKDTLVKRLSPLLKDAGSIAQARSIISNNLDGIQKIAELVVAQNGYQYPVSISLENTYFPLKIYGKFSFPPGTYEALRVKIGNAEGKNWWCVMFPPLCFVDETYSIVDDSSDEKLKQLLTEEEYNTLINKKTPVRVKFKLLESIKNLFHL